MLNLLKYINCDDEDKYDLIKYAKYYYKQIYKYEYTNYVKTRGPYHSIYFNKYHHIIIHRNSFKSDVNIDNYIRETKERIKLYNLVDNDYLFINIESGCWFNVDFINNLNKHFILTYKNYYISYNENVLKIEYHKITKKSKHNYDDFDIFAGICNKLNITDLYISWDGEIKQHCSHFNTLKILYLDNPIVRYHTLSDDKFKNLEYLILPNIEILDFSIPKNLKILYIPNCKTIQIDKSIKDYNINIIYAPQFQHFLYKRNYYEDYNVIINKMCKYFICDKFSLGIDDLMFRYFSEINPKTDYKYLIENSYYYNTFINSSYSKDDLNTSFTDFIKFIETNLNVSNLLRMLNKDSEIAMICILSEYINNEIPNTDLNNLIDNILFLQLINIINPVISITHKPFMMIKNKTEIDENESDENEISENDESEFDKNESDESDESDEFKENNESDEFENI